MKLFFLLSLTSLIFSQTDTLQNLSNQKGPILTFDSVLVDFGVVEQNSDMNRTITFTNTGNEPLVITRASTSCGCDSTEYPKEPILPGQKGIITYTYDTKRIGLINKSIAVYSNCIKAPFIVLKITGEVLEPMEKY